MRSAARGFAVGAAPLLAAAALVVAPSGVRAALPSAGADDCPDVEVIFARGTGEPAGVGKVGRAFIDSLRQDTGMSFDVYGVNYPAGKLQLGGGDGANDTISRVKATVQKCPQTQIVLGGYSQGASVMDIVAGVPVGGVSWGSALPPQYVDNIAALVTFGNIADRSGSPLSSQSALLGSKTIDMCNGEDPICHAGPGNEWSGHTEGYAPTYTTQAASIVASRLRIAGPGLFPGIPGTPGLPSTPGVPGVPGLPGPSPTAGTNAAPPTVVVR